ncbi:MAG: hypothetical protein ACFFGZ_19765 [Candidatus Thorarchaeota archaeon]
MQDSESSANSFFASLKHDFELSSKWLKVCLDEADWRYHLLIGILRFGLTKIKSIESIGDNYLLEIRAPVKKREVRVFLEIINHLTLAQPIMLPQEGSETFFVLMS